MLSLQPKPALLQSLQTSKDLHQQKEVEEAQRAIFNLFPNLQKQIEKHVGTPSGKDFQGK